MNSPTESRQRLITELQTKGLRLTHAEQRHVSRRGGAGPSDHQAVTVDGTTLMVPIYSDSAWQSPFSVDSFEQGELVVKVEGDKTIPIKNVSFLKELIKLLPSSSPMI